MGLPQIAQGSPMARHLSRILRLAAPFALLGFVAMAPPPLSRDCRSLLDSRSSARHAMISDAKQCRDFRKKFLRSHLQHDTLGIKRKTKGLPKPA